MAEITGGELLLKCLQKEGLTFSFGIDDKAYHTIIHKCDDYGIRFVAPRHEAAAVHMAQGVHKTTGKVTAVLAGGGPGTANLISGVICAAAEGVPVIAITAQRRREVVYPSRVGVYQGCDQLDFFRPFTKWNAVIHSWDRIPEIVQRAFRECFAGRPGPVHIDIPDSVMNATGDASSLKILEPYHYRCIEPMEPNAKDIEEIAGLLTKAQNPLVMAGTGVLNAEGWGDFVELVELLNCPAITSMAGRTALPDNHPNNIRGYTEGWLAVRREADVVLAVGTCLGEIDLPFKKYWGAANQTIIQVDMDPRNIGINMPVSMGIVADARSTLKALVTCLKEMGVKPSDGTKVLHYQQIVKKWYAETVQPIMDSFSDDKIHPAQPILAARQVFPAEAINVADGGNTSLFNAFFTEFTKPRTSLGLFEFGHLGTGIPSAIGAKLANPDRDVYCITGDGAAGFNFMEMETALREKAKITVIVHAEGSWCMEEIGHIMAGADPSRYESVVQLPVRWDKTAESMGCCGEYVEKADELHEAIRRAKDSELPAVVCVKTDRQANLMPPGLALFAQVYTGAV